MLNLPILESFFDKPIVAGYSLRSIFEYWWIGLIILIVGALAIVGTYFLLNWLFGRMKYKEGDKETVEAYGKADRAGKKTFFGSGNGYRIQNGLCGEYRFSRRFF